MLESWYVALPHNPLPRLLKPRSQGSRWPAPGAPRFEPKKCIEIYLKIFFFRTTWLRCLKFGMLHCQVVFYQVCSNKRAMLALNRSPEFKSSKTQCGRGFWYLRLLLEQTEKSSTMQLSTSNFKYLRQVVLKHKIFYNIAYVFLCFKPRSPWHKAISDPWTLV